MSRYTLHQGDSREVLKALSENSVDAIVCDPPYHLTTGKNGGSGEASVNLNTPQGRARVTTGFMGMQWDGGDVANRPEVWAECLRVAKPGAWLLAFGGTRTFHRMACAIEDAGWEIRDTLMWVYGSGFPKSRNVCLDMDKMDGHGNRGHRIAVANRHHPDGTLEPNGEHLPAYEPKTDAAKQWAGWGTALKPAWEPIIMARKPMVGTVAANVLAHGTGGLNIDGCRVPVDREADASQLRTMQRSKREADDGWGMSSVSGDSPSVVRTDGRWPANLIHDGSDEVLALFPQSTAPGRFPKNSGGIGTTSGIYGKAIGRDQQERELDTGSAARFFYCAKASREDREEGINGTKKLFGMSGAAAAAAARGDHYDNGDGGVNKTTLRHNIHPTVKPTDLMAYLCRLVTPAGGTVLDPFMGSGSTGKAAMREGFHFIGIDLSAEYIEIARARIDFALRQGHQPSLLESA